MKTINTLLLLLTISVFSCDNNDDSVTPDPVDSSTTQDGFTYHKNDGTTTFYETTNAYIEIDEDDNDAYSSVPDYYSFFFLNGRMIDNDTTINDPTYDEVLFSLNTSIFARFKIDVVTNSSLNTGIPPSANNTYVASANDTVLGYGVQVNPLATPYYLTLNGTSFEFGEGDDNVGTWHSPATLGHSVTINAMNLDTNNPSNSTIDVDYTFVNTSGEAFIGHYEGTLGVFED